MKKLILSTFAVMLLLIASATAQPGFGRGMHKGMMGMKGINNLPGFRFYEMFQSDLKISDKQIDQMKAIDSKFNDEVIDLKAEAQHTGLKMKDEISKTDIDKNAILSNQDNLSNVKNKIAKRVMTYKIDLYNVLTKEQKGNSKTLRMKMMKEHHGSRKGMGKRNSDCNGPKMRSRGRMK